LFSVTPKNNLQTKEKSMQDFNGYVPIEELLNLGNGIILWKCKKNNFDYEVLDIPHSKNYEKTLSRIWQSEIKFLINRDISGIQKIVDFGTNKNSNFIVYEKLDDVFSAKIETMRDIAIGLYTLYTENQECFVISKNNIKDKLQFVGLFDFFKKMDLLDKNYLSPNETSPNFQDDIYSLVKVFEDTLIALNNDKAKEILQRGLEPVRTKRFSKYNELIDLLNDICLQNRKNLKIITSSKNFLQILKEMNKFCELRIESKRSKKEEISVKFRTDNWSGIFYVNERQNYVFVPDNSCNPRNDPKADNINWFVANFSFSLDKDSTIDCFDEFVKRFENINQLASLNRIKKENVEKWQTMPEKEKEFIEENAFRVRYHNVKFRGTNAVFYLTNDFNNWETVKKLKNEKTLLYIAYSIINIITGKIDLIQIKVGKIGEFHSGNNILVIKDILCKPEELAKEGNIFEDTRQRVSQFKKQMEACQKFLTLDVVNPVLCSILANPDTAAIPPNNLLKARDYDNFKNKVFNEKLKTDETQLEAVLEATTYKPIYLIQGPPGTGKTTVIVECIRQILNKQNQPNAKILITSQSNLAVDNVLERIDEINQNEGQNLIFMRLASENEEKGINVTETIKPHTYDKKLRNWANKTIDNNEEFMKTKFSVQENNKILVEFYNTTKTFNDFNKFKEVLNKQPNNYIKKLFENIENMQEAEEKFADVLGKDYLKLKDIQREWVAFLNNATKNKINNGSKEIDFLTAMIMNTNIIGATCIHIASSKYSDMNLEFDYVIMDESSKASPAETLVPINMGRNIVLIGDHKQLPPVVTREDAVRKKVKEELEDNGLDIEKEFGESLFEKLITAFEADDDKKMYVKMLDIQYRMPKQIGTLISKFFYGEKLRNPDKEIIPDFDDSKKHNLNLKKDTSIVFLSTSGRENCNDNGNKYFRQNECNMKIIKETLTKLNELCQDNLQKEKPFTIGIIAGYRGQVDLLQKNINLEQYGNFVIVDDKGAKTNLIEINTVDKFQGAERDIIIYDIVRSDKGSANIGFLDDYRRINVAFSRAKRLLIIVGDSEYIIERATLNPGGKFKEFKLQDIAKYLDNKDLIFNNLEEIF
jgi:superfamily I DNA and/or RNA helicase